MVIFLNLDGTAEKVVPEHIYQGSNNVTDITVIAPYAATTAMEIGFILPNGLYWQSSDGARYAPMLQIQQDINPDVSAWSFTLPLSVTERHGDVYIAINAKTANTVTKGNTTSYLCKITVEESVLPDLPSAPEPGVYDLIQQYLAQLDARTIDVPNLVRSIEKVAPNAFTFTTANGIESAPIVLEGGQTSPMPLNIATTIDIPSSAWTFLATSDDGMHKYFVTITSAEHGQLRDGAKVNNLWVSFDRYNRGSTDLSGSYYGYTVASNGDINLTYTTTNPITEPPPHMTIRVWNGRVTDATARREIAAEVNRAINAENQLQADINAEQSRAETAEQNLQNQIDEIEQSGVDLTARKQIAEETARAKAAEENLDDIIQLFSLDLSDTQKDVRKINSYIPPGTGSATSTQLTNRTFVTNFVNSSINNMAAFYITSNAQGDAFPTRASLINATTYYYAGQARTPTQNDYAIVLADESQPKGVDGNYPTTRYSYQGTQWSFQYVVNNTSLTQAQVDAINSGITAKKIESQDNAIAGKVDKSGDTMTGDLSFTSGNIKFPNVCPENSAPIYFVTFVRNSSREGLAYTTTSDMPFTTSSQVDQKIAAAITTALNTPV